MPLPRIIKHVPGDKVGRTVTDWLEKAKQIIVEPEGGDFYKITVIFP
jgi:hypothetical protein